MSLCFRIQQRLTTIRSFQTHGLLLDFHVRNDARDKLLGQVGLRAYSQVFAVLRSMWVLVAVPSEPLIPALIHNQASFLDSTSKHQTACR